MGAWCLYGLGTENANMPGYVAIVCATDEHWLNLTQAMDRHDLRATRIDDVTGGTFDIAVGEQWYSRDLLQFVAVRLH